MNLPKVFVPDADAATEKLRCSVNYGSCMYVFETLGRTILAHNELMPSVEKNGEPDLIWATW